MLLDEAIIFWPSSSMQWHPGSGVWFFGLSLKLNICGLLAKLQLAVFDLWCATCSLAALWFAALRSIFFGRFGARLVLLFRLSIVLFVFTTVRLLPLFTNLLELHSELWFPSLTIVSIVIIFFIHLNKCDPFCFFWFAWVLSLLLLCYLEQLRNLALHYLRLIYVQLHLNALFFLNLGFFLHLGDLVWGIFRLYFHVVVVGEVNFLIDCVHFHFFF